jgi:hypothetical protein
MLWVGKVSHLQKVMLESAKDPPRTTGATMCLVWNGLLTN